MSLTLNSNPIVVENTIIVKIKSQNLKILRGEISHNLMNDARGAALILHNICLFIQALLQYLF